MLSIAQIVIDCADAGKLAGFWSQALSRPVDEGASAYFATVGGSPKLMFLKVPEPKQTKNRLHLDLSGPGWAAEVDRLLGLGAVKMSEHQEYGTEWVTLADPEGNEFDVGAGLAA
jgi:hypothetical protein